MAAGYVLGMRVDATSYPDLVAKVMSWADNAESRAISVATVQVVMEGYDRPVYRQLVNDCDVVTPDGMPLVWFLRAIGIADASRVYGPDLTLSLLQAANEKHLAVGFYGGSPEALEGFLAAVRRHFPNVNVVYAYSPPFRSLSLQEDAKVVRDICSSGVRILFVGLGCPKQEQWVSTHRGSIPAVMIGVGAAFDFLSGAKPQAPKWMQRNGLEWLFRFATEPRRLFWRYTRQNPRFVFFAGRQLLLHRRAQRTQVTS